MSFALSKRIFVSLINERFEGGNFVTINEVALFAFIHVHQWACCEEPRREVEEHDVNELQPNMECL